MTQQTFPDEFLAGTSLLEPTGDKLAKQINILTAATKDVRRELRQRGGKSSIDERVFRNRRLISRANKLLKEIRIAAKD